MSKIYLWYITNIKTCGVGVKSLGEHTFLQNQTLFGKICTNYERSYSKTNLLDLMSMFSSKCFHPADILKNWTCRCFPGRNWRCLCWGEDKRWRLAILVPVRPRSQLQPPYSSVERGLPALIQQHPARSLPILSPNLSLSSHQGQAHTALHIRRWREAH